MNSQIISKEGTSVKLSFDVTPEKFEEGMKYSYNKNKSKISVDSNCISDKMKMVS